MKYALLEQQRVKSIELRHFFHRKFSKKRKSNIDNLKYIKLLGKSNRYFLVRVDCGIL